MAEGRQGEFRAECNEGLRGQQSKPELLELLREHSHKSGAFTLASGKQSDFYIDCKQTFLRREGLWLAASRLYASIRMFDAVGVAGEGAGGVPLAAAVSMHSRVFGHKQLHPVVVRKAVKDHGTTQRVERARDVVPDGSRVVLVEDVLTSGGSALRAVKALQDDGLNVVAVIALVSRREGAEELFYYEDPELISLYKREDFIGV
jgi:orotate phosphoribosyltransferase